MRYAKQIKLPNFGIEAQKKLNESSVLVIGAGGLGCPVLTYLVSAGIGSIGIIDFDIIEESNLPRQPLYLMKDIGKSKVEVAALRLQAMNPDVTIKAIPAMLNVENAGFLIKQYNIIADCSDNFTARYLINDTCVRLNKPWVFGSIEGWEGQVSAFNFQNGPTYRCLYPEPPGIGESLNCNDIGIIGTVAAITGSMQANEIIKCITGCGESLSGKLWIADLFHNQFSIISYERNEDEISKLRLNQQNTNSLELSMPEFLNGSYNIIDIREHFEFEQEPSEGKNIPYDELIRDFNRFSENENFLLLCSEGKRSLFLANYLREKHSFGNIFSLQGGWGKLKNFMIKAK